MILQFVSRDAQDIGFDGIEMIREIGNMFAVTVIECLHLRRYLVQQFEEIFLVA